MAHAGQLHHGNLAQIRLKSQLNGSNGNLVHGLHACLRPPSAASSSALNDDNGAQIHNEWPLLGWAAHAVYRISGQAMTCILTDDAAIIHYAHSGPDPCCYQDPACCAGEEVQHHPAEGDRFAAVGATRSTAKVCMHACCLLQRISTYPCQECLLAAIVQSVLTCFLLSCGLLSECWCTHFTRIKQNLQETACLSVLHNPEQVFTL